MAVVSITEKAREKVEGFRAGVPDAETQAMWIEVTGVQGGEWTYNMSLKPLDQAGSDDVVEQEDGLAVVIPPRAPDALAAPTAAWPENPFPGGLTIENPKTPSPPMGA